MADTERETDKKAERESETEAAKNTAGEGKPLVVALSGPTGSGKSRLAVMLAREMGGEVISCDSMQIYRGMDIGTGKVTPEEQGGIPHHLLDIADAEQSFSLSDFISLAKNAIAEVSGRGHLPILCGGTGLYSDHLLNGTVLSETPSDPAVREELEKLDGETLWTMLAEVDTESARSIHPNNRKRLVRALEIYQLTGKSKTLWDRESKSGEPPYRVKMILLLPKDRQTLYDAINTRVDRMFEAGLPEEVEKLFAGRISQTAGQAIGYKEFLPYFSGQATLAEVREQIKQASRNYAKRQMTWFRQKEESSLVIDCTLPSEEQLKIAMAYIIAS